MHTTVSNTHGLVDPSLRLEYNIAYKARLHSQLTFYLHPAHDRLHIVLPLQQNFNNYCNNCWRYDARNVGSFMLGWKIPTGPCPTIADVHARSLPKLSVQPETNAHVCIKQAHGPEPASDLLHVGL